MDSRSAVTALSCKFYQTLLKAGTPVGVLRPMDRRLRGANGSPIAILGCSSCMVSFLGLLPVGPGRSHPTEVGPTTEDG